MCRMSDMMKCDWCGEEHERKDLKYWHTGALICIGCFDEADEKNKQMMKELFEELRGKGLDNAGW